MSKEANQKQFLADKKRIKELGEESDMHALNWAKLVSSLREEINTQDTRIDRLAAIIDEAPHFAGCASLTLKGGSPCNCFKAKS